MRTLPSWLAVLACFLSGAVVSAVHADEAVAPRLDRLGFPLPAGAVGRLGSAAFHQGSRITALAYSPDGKTLASGSEDSVIHLWDVVSGHEVRALRGHHFAIGSLRFSHDGTYLASTEVITPNAALPNGANPPEMIAILWDAKSGKDLQHFPSHAQPLLAFSPDDRLLAIRSSNPAGVQFWETATGKKGRLFGEIAGDLQALVFTENGRALATCTIPGNGDGGMMDDNTPPVTGGLVVWDVASGRRRFHQAEPGQGVASAVFAPNGKILAILSDNGPTRLYEVASGKARPTIGVRGRRGTDVPLTGVFSADSRLLAMRIGHRVRVINLAELGTESSFPVAAIPPRSITQPTPGAIVVPVPPDPNSPVLLTQPLALAPDGRTLAFGGDHQVIRFWDLKTGKEQLPSEGHRGPVKAVACSPDGKLIATAGEDRVVRLWDTTSRQEVRQLRGHGASIDSLVFSSDSKTLASVAAEEGLVRVWDVASGTSRHQFPMGIADLLRSGNPLLAAWPMMMPTPQPTVNLHPVEGAGCAFVDGGRALAIREYRIRDTATTGYVVVWDLATGKELRKIEVVSSTTAEAPKPNNDPLPPAAAPAPAAPNPLPFFGITAPNVSFALAATADGKLLATASAGALDLWDTATGKRLRSFRIEREAAALAFSPDGTTLAVTNAKDVPRIGLGMLGGFGPGPAPAAPDPGDDDDETTLVALFDVSTGEERQHLDGHTGSVIGLAFSADSQRLATIAADDTLRLWQSNTGKQLGRIDINASGLKGVAFATEGRELAIAQGDGSVLVWATADLLGRYGDAAAPELRQAWERLAHADADVVSRALRALQARPRQTVELLRGQLTPVKADADLTKKIKGWIADLESDKFAVREKAASELQKCGELAEGELLKVLGSNPTLDLRQRIEQIQRLIEQRQQSDVELRPLRAIEVLEQIGTPEAREVLRTLGQGVAEARLTLEATAALRRMERSAAAPSK